MQPAHARHQNSEQNWLFPTFILPQNATMLPRVYFPRLLLSSPKIDFSIKIKIFATFKLCTQVNLKLWLNRNFWARHAVGTTWDNELLEIKFIPLINQKIYSGASSQSLRKLSELEFTTCGRTHMEKLLASRSTSKYFSGRCKLLCFPTAADKNESLQLNRPIFPICSC